MFSEVSTYLSGRFIKYIKNSVYNSDVRVENTRTPTVRLSWLFIVDCEVYSSQ